MIVEIKEGEEAAKMDKSSGEDEAGSAKTGKSKRPKAKAVKKSAAEKELESLKETLAALEKERDEAKERMLRLHAETENFKKRITKEKEDFQKYANENLVKEFLPVIDNLERAVAHAKESGESGGFLEGVEMTLNMFGQSLERLGVKEVPAEGETFDPEMHEAVQQIESGDHEPNIVVSAFQKGYMLKERLIRPAMVVVSKSPEKKQ